MLLSTVRIYNSQFSQQSICHLILILILVLFIYYLLINVNYSYFELFFVFIFSVFILIKILVNCHMLFCHWDIRIFIYILHIFYFYILHLNSSYFVLVV